MDETLKSAANKVVGLKQLLRHVEQNDIERVYIAQDADEDVKDRIKSAIAGKDIAVVDVDSKDELGDFCGIDVGTSCAAILKN